MERNVSATETRVRFGEMVRRVVEGGETLIVERSGRLYGRSPAKSVDSHPNQKTSFDSVSVFFSPGGPAV